MHPWLRGSSTLTRRREEEEVGEEEEERARCRRCRSEGHRRR
jgi:hypothetical protein